MHAVPSIGKGKYGFSVWEQRLTSFSSLPGVSLAMPLIQKKRPIRSRMGRFYMTDIQLPLNTLAAQIPASPKPPLGSSGSEGSAGVTGSLGTGGSSPLFPPLLSDGGL